MDSLPPRRWLLRGVIAVIVGALLLGAAVAAATHEPASLGPATIERPANNSTVISVQGFHYQGIGNDKKPARLVSVGPHGATRWMYNGSKYGAQWFYDVDPLSNGNLLVTSTVPGDTVVFALDPRSGERVWTERFDAKDTHDIDLINDDQLLVANLRNLNESTGISNDRLFIYDRSKGEIVWEWKFNKLYPKSTDGGYSGDWSHANDIDKINEGSYLVSPRNFDQVIVVNRTAGDIEMRLGSDGDHHTLFEQHNPDYLNGRNGTPTILVADSENDRVVEYRKTENGWNRTWSLSGEFNWPRDADRLPNGNTLVVDTLNHRIVEVTPTGEVVWEFYAPWAPYDAERLGVGNEAVPAGPTRSVGGSHGPTMAELNVTSHYTVTGGTEGSPDNRERFAAWVTATVIGTPVQGAVQAAVDRYEHITPFVRPVWMSSWAFAALLGVMVVVLLWGIGEAWYQRRRIERLAGRVRTRL